MLVRLSGTTGVRAGGGGLRVKVQGRGPPSLPVSRLLPPPKPSLQPRIPPPPPSLRFLPLGNVRSSALPLLPSLAWPFYLRSARRNDSRSDVSPSPSPSGREGPLSVPPTRGPPCPVRPRTSAGREGVGVEFEALPLTVVVGEPRRARTPPPPSVRPAVWFTVVRPVPPTVGRHGWGGPGSGLESSDLETPTSLRPRDHPQPLGLSVSDYGGSTPV